MLLLRPSLQRLLTSCGAKPTNVRAVSGLESTTEWRQLLDLPRPRSIEALFGAAKSNTAEFTADGFTDGQFRSSEDRAQAMSITVGDLVVDFSRQLVDDTIFEALISLAKSRGVEAKWRQLRSGESINTTENRAVGHVALRCRPDEEFMIGGRNVVPEVHATLRRMESLAQGLRQGIVTGSTGRRIRTVVNIGIGGSDLGPSLMYEALRPLSSGEISCRFVSNVDPADLTQQLQGLDPGETLIVVSSKTFTTSETMANATVARQWLTQTLGEDGAKQHLVAVSANSQAVSDFGISEERFFPLWEWVGGRFSLGSAVGLSTMISLGPDVFREFLEGQRLMDRHVDEFSGASNVSLVMALIGVWNRCVLGYPTRAVLPYSYNLRSLPAYLQQLIMESNGKGVHVDGSIVSHPTTPVIWGGAGTDAQHAFMQFIHQSPDVVPIDFVGFARASNGNDERQRMLFMNLVAQAEALAFGRPSAEAPHRSFPGNRPSTVIIAPVLSPFVFGQIVALYEHAVFYEGALLDINSFDQWGVELGKELAQGLMVIRQDAGSVDNSNVHPASRRLLDWFHHQSAQDLGAEQGANP